MNEIILRGPEGRLPQESFSKILFKQLLHGGHQVAAIDAVTGEETTYKEILNRSISLAIYLKKLGLTKNDAISICSQNTFYFSIPIISALFLGITIAPVNHNYTYKEYIHTLNLSKPKVIFCSTQVLDIIIKVSKEIKSIKKIIIINKCDKLPQSIQNIRDFFYNPIPENFDVSPVDPEHVAAILCSSGTTGLPKGVMLTHKNFLAGYVYIKHPGFGNYNCDKIGLALLPFYHAYGFLSQLYKITVNMKMIVLPQFEARLFLNTIEKYHVTLASLVPPLILFLAKSPIVDEYDLSSLKTLVCGAAPLGKELTDAVMKRLNVKIKQGYGLTEITLAASLQPELNRTVGTVGVIVPGIDCKIIDLETGKSLGPNKNGELCFRGTLVMKGYVGDKKATDATIDKDGWLHSGDIGYYDNNQYLYIVDRLKELIKYKGFQVPPAELEALLLTHPQILDCGVVGKFDTESAEELATAFVVKKPNATIKEIDVINFVAENISYHKRLHGGVIFVEDIPKSPTGKILRRALRERLNTPLSKL